MLNSAGQPERREVLVFQQRPLGGWLKEECVPLLT